MAIASQFVADISATTITPSSTLSNQGAQSTSETDFSASLTAVSQPQDQAGQVAQKHVHRDDKAKEKSQTEESTSVDASDHSDDLLTRIAQSRQQSTNIKSAKHSQHESTDKTDKETHALETESESMTAQADEQKSDEDADSPASSDEALPADLQALLQTTKQADVSLTAQVAAVFGAAAEPQKTDLSEMTSTDDSANIDALKQDDSASVSKSFGRAAQSLTASNQLVSNNLVSNNEGVNQVQAGNAQPMDDLQAIDAQLTVMSESLAAEQTQATDISESKSSGKETTDSSKDGLDVSSELIDLSKTANKSQQTSSFTFEQLMSNKPAVQTPVASVLTQTNDSKNNATVDDVKEDKKTESVSTKDSSPENTQAQSSNANVVQQNTQTQPTAEQTITPEAAVKTESVVTSSTSTQAAQTNTTNTATQAIQHRLESVYVNNQQLDDASMANRVMYMVSNQLKEAEIALNPEGLGSVRVKVSLDDQTQQTNVQFVTQTSQARDVLDHSLTKLRDMMGQQGLQLGQTSVHQQSAGNQSGSQAWQQFNNQASDSGSGQNGRSSSSGHDAQNGEIDTESAQSVSYTSTIDDGVDFYA